MLFNSLFICRTGFSKQTDAGATLLLFLWLCGGLTYVLPNHGGAGLNLPQNLMAWGFMALISLWCIFHFSSGKIIILPAGSGLMIAGVLLWSLPLLWTPRADWRLNALPKVIALWGLAGFYVLLLISTSCRRMRTRWLFILVLATLIQAGYALWQLKDLAELPRGRPYGSFQQANVLASFLVTGLACALWLFLQQGRRAVRFTSGCALFIIPAVLVFLQSRAGNIGAILSTVLLISLVCMHKKKRSMLALFIIASGAGAGFFGFCNGHYFFPHFMPAVKESSTLSRWNMVKLTLQMIQMHPLAGNGYGSFEAVYGQLAQATSTGLDNATIEYPHNEFLYAWAEGGLTAVFGILLMVAGIFRRLWSTGGTRFVGVALLLPIAVHMNLEYPIYQSMTHGLTLVMLLVVCAGGSNHRESAESVTDHSAGRLPPGYFNLTWRCLAGLLSIGVFLFMMTGLQTQQEITRAEQRGLRPLAFEEQSVMHSLLNPYSQFSRIDFDRHVALLLRFNQTRDAHLLAQFRFWAERYLHVHNNPEVYFSLLKILRAQQSPSAESVCREAKGRWINDPRFICQE